MTLAEELMGITPQVTSRGRFVIQHVDAEPPPPIITDRMAAVDAWMENRKGPFTTYDIAEDLGLTVKQASNQLRRYKKQGRITFRGKIWTGRMPLLSWSYTPDAQSR
jgi:CRP-like cAMP-binding protein